jgi:hypothetical protein
LGTTSLEGPITWKDGIMTKTRSAHYQGRQSADALALAGFRHRRRAAKIEQATAIRLQSASLRVRFRKFLDSAVPLTAVLSTLITAIALIYAALAYSSQVSANVEQQRAIVVQAHAIEAQLLTAEIQKEAIASQENAIASQLKYAALLNKFMAVEQKAIRNSKLGH